MKACGLSHSHARPVTYMHDPIMKITPPYPPRKAKHGLRMSACVWVVSKHIPPLPPYIPIQTQQTIMHTHMNRCVRIMSINRGYYRSEEVYVWSGGDIVRSSRDGADNSRDEGVVVWLGWVIGGYGVELVELWWSIAASLFE